MRLNLALVFVFILCCSAFLLIDECVPFCCVGFRTFFHTKRRDRLGELSPKLPVFCRVGRKTATQSIIAGSRVEEWREV